MQTDNLKKIIQVGICITYIILLGSYMAYSYEKFDTSKSALFCAPALAFLFWKAALILKPDLFDTSLIKKVLRFSKLLSGAILIGMGFYFVILKAAFNSGIFGILLFFAFVWAGTALILTTIRQDA